MGPSGSRRALFLAIRKLTDRRTRASSVLAKPLFYGVSRKLVPGEALTVPPRWEFA